MRGRRCRDRWLAIHTTSKATTCSVVGDRWRAIHQCNQSKPRTYAPAPDSGRAPPRRVPAGPHSRPPRPPAWAASAWTGGFGVEEGGESAAITYRLLRCRLSSTTIPHGLNHSPTTHASYPHLCIYMCSLTTRPPPTHPPCPHLCIYTCSTTTRVLTHLAPEGVLEGLRLEEVHALRLGRVHEEAHGDLLAPQNDREGVGRLGRHLVAEAGLMLVLGWQVGKCVKSSKVKSRAHGLSSLPWHGIHTQDSRKYACPMPTGPGRPAR